MSAPRKLASWNLFDCLPDFVLRRLFDEAWLKARTAVELRGCNGVVTVCGHALPRVGAWLDVANTGYFTLWLDRISLQVSCGTARAKFSSVARTRIDPGVTVSLYVHDTLTPRELAGFAVETVMPDSRAAFQATADFTCRLSRFSVHAPPLTDIRLRLVLSDSQRTARPRIASA